MQITKEWILYLAKKYGKSPKDLRKKLWPAANHDFGYFDKTNNPGVRYVETLADELGCTVDELLRRPTAPYPFIAGDYNSVGNVSINNDEEGQKAIISYLEGIIKYQAAEIVRINSNLKEQLKVKDKQIESLIQIAKGSGNQ